jgi:surfactin synthase thioesterase subunit
VKKRFGYCVSEEKIRLLRQMEDLYKEIIREKDPGILENPWVLFGLGAVGGIIAYKALQ